MPNFFNPDSIPPKYSELERKLIISFAQDYGVSVKKMLKHIDIKGVLPPINMEENKYTLEYSSNLLKFHSVINGDELKSGRIQKIQKIRKKTKRKNRFKINLHTITNVFK